MDPDGSALLLSLLVSCVGLACAVYGKRQGRIPQMVAGLVLLVFPYFVANLALMAAIAASVLALLALAVRLGL